jgi:large repetitive protein
MRSLRERGPRVRGRAGAAHTDLTTTCAVRHVCYVARPVGVKRLLPIVVVALFASLAIVSGAPAGDFADEPCPDQGGIATCPAGSEGAPYSLTIKLKDGSGCGPGLTTWSVSSGTFPPGLSLGSSDGVISGTPTQAGEFIFYITVSYPVLTDPACNGGFSDKQFKLPINPGVPPVPKLVIGPEQAGVPISTVGAAFSLQMTANLADAKTWSIGEGSLPPGLQLGSTDGVISGTPTTAGTYAFTVRAQIDAQRVDTKALSIVVRDPISIVATGLAGATAAPASEVGVRFSARLEATGGSGTYTWSSAGSLPSGVVFSPTGDIAGRPTVAGTYRFTVTATDSEGRTATYNGVLTVAPRLAVATTRLKIGRVGRFYQVKLRARGGVAPWTSRIKRGPLPRGILFDRTTGVFFGTPTKVGIWRITVEMIDALGVKTSATVTLIVRR